MSTPKITPKNNETQDEFSTPHSLARKKHFKRRFFLILGPLAVAVVSAYMYLTGGRFIETDNAYLQADKVAISAEISGPIVALMVAENDHVEQGTPLFKIDDRSYAIALEQAKASFQGALAEIRMQKGSYRQKTNELGLAQSNINFARKEFVRQSTLESSQAVARARLDDAEHSLQVSQFRFAIIKNEMEQILAGLEGDPEISADQVASYRLAKAVVEKAALDLERTTIVAPFSGRVSKIPQPGKHVAPGTPVMSLIADRSFWIEANLKETELTHVHPGQKVNINVDTYPEHTFAGTVQSISPGTGSEFSIIPAQNATGNWVKVVQRIPVRIRVEEQNGEQVLRSGMSTQISIDTTYQRPLPFLVGKVLAAVGITREAVAAPQGARH